MERAVRMIKTGDLNPHFFDYPSFYIYVQACVAAVRFLVGRDPGPLGRAGAGHERRLLRLGPRRDRALGLRHGLGGLTGSAPAGTPGSALLSAALLAVMPLHVRESH